MDNVVLALKPDVKVICQEGITGLSLLDRKKLAHDHVQEKIISAISGGGQQLVKLKAIISSERCAGEDDPAAALALASFILDFNNYLET